MGTHPINFSITDFGAALSYVRAMKKHVAEAR
jgi:hypothetical protein